MSQINAANAATLHDRVEVENTCHAPTPTFPPDDTAILPN